MRYDAQSTKAILYRTQWVFLVVSIVPLAFLAYISVSYVFPLLYDTKQESLILSIYVALSLTVLLSVLGYILTKKTTETTLRRIDQANGNLVSLLGLAQKLSQAETVDTCLKEATRAAVSILDAKVGLVYQLDGTKLVCKFAKGVALPQSESFVLEMGQAPAGRAARDKQTLLISDSKENQEDPFGLQSKLELGSMICYPLLQKGNCIAVFEFYRTRQQEGFSEQEQIILEVLGQQVSASIVSAQSHEVQKNYFSHVTELLRLSMEQNIVWEGHLNNVARYCNAIGRVLELDDEQRRELHFGAILHDVGLMKLRPIPSDWSQPEFQKKLREHPHVGSTLIEPIQVWNNVVDLIKHHHEYVDGSGYPNGLKGDSIPLGAKIICVAQAVDSMLNPQSYLRKKSDEEVITHLTQEAGKKYDKRVAAAMIEFLEQEHGSGQ